MTSARILTLTGEGELKRGRLDGGCDMSKWLRLFSVVLLLAPATLAQAHGGGLNSDGCHNNRKTGEYHCHRGGSTPPRSSQQPQQLTSSSGGAFRNCAEARAAGAAPVRRGDPGYGPHLDRDGDGVGCEPYRR